MKCNTITILCITLCVAASLNAMRSGAGAGLSGSSRNSTRQGRNYEQDYIQSFSQRVMYGMQELDLEADDQADMKDEKSAYDAYADELDRQAASKRRGSQGAD